MRKTLFVFLIVCLLAIPSQVKAEGETMQRWYIVPAEVSGYMRAPKYFASRVNGGVGIVCQWKNLYYGKLNTVMVLALDITPADDVFLTSQVDVYAFPLNIDLPVTDKAVLDVLLEPLFIPTDWLTPSTQYRELIRRMYSMFAFSNRYEILSNGHALFGEASIGLDTQFKNMTVEQQAWFTATVESFGYPANLIKQNATMRQMLKAASDAFTLPFELGGITF